VNQQPIILFDGICNLCNGSVNFVIKRNNKKEIRFAALQSEIAQKLLKDHSLPVDEIQSIILIENSTAYTQSTAALRISRYLNGFVAALLRAHTCAKIHPERYL
jgi:predicted DCC family thiol-disulfide oxidoreductase YuxK